MKPATRPLLLALALAAPASFAHANGNAAPPSAGRRINDSVPSSLGADGWAAVDGPVTGGCGATLSRIHHVHNRAPARRAR